MLKQAPNPNHLSRMYFELAKLGARAIGEHKPWPYQPQSPEAHLTLAAEMSRYDPRLFGVLVDFLYSHWQTINPMQLRQHMNKMTTPQIIAVLASFVAPQLGKPESDYFFEYLTRGLQPVATQLFFINLYPLGSRLLEKATLESLQEFSTWGFLARERPIIHGLQRQAIGHWGPQARQNIIRRISARDSTISIADYLHAVAHTISRQQALLDLKQSPHIKASGKGRGSVWTANSQNEI